MATNAPQRRGSQAAQAEEGNHFGAMSGPGDTRGQDGGAVARIVPAYLPAAYRLAAWLLRDPRAAEDVVQDSAERALRHADSYRGGDARAWFLRIVRNQALDRLSSARPMAELDEQTPDEAPGPEDTLQRHEGSMALQAALAALPPVLRECLVLREFEELSYRQIADITGVPVGTVMSRLWKARQTLMTLTQGLRT